MDVTKSVIVPVTVDEAFRLFTEQPAQWLPAAHTFLRDPVLIAMEPWTGGRFYERGGDGTEITRGTILDWAPPTRLVVTWRIGANWQPVFDDEQASRIRAEFRPADTAGSGTAGSGTAGSGTAGSDTAGSGTAGSTEVALTYTELDRHGAFATQLRAAIEAGDPGESLQNYADLAARRGWDNQGT
jgi:uncharacterized protein YndB with AHSA1/START domain